MPSQVCHGGVEVGDVEGEMVAADVAVARRSRLLSGGLVLEDLEVRTACAPEEAQLAHHGTRVDAEVVAHPGAVGTERAERVDVLAADHLDEEPGRLFEVGNGEADVLDAYQPGKSPLSITCGMDPSIRHDSHIAPPQAP